jgi:cation:H+ antiporter
MPFVSLFAAFVSGVLLVLVASKLLIEISKELAIKWRLSPLIVSLILVALGTNLPEFTVMISALWQHDAGLALGNVVGSNISNITLIFGAGALLHAPRIGTNKTPKNALIMLLLTLLFVGLEISILPEQIQGVILFVFLIGFISYEIYLGKKGRKHEDKHLLDLEIAKTPKLKFLDRKNGRMVSLLALIGSVLGLVIGSQIVVQSITQLSDLLNISTTILGITLVATTTSLPELITIIVAGQEKEDKMIIGTLIGSNIYNLSFFAPFVLLSPYKANLPITDLAFLALTTFFFVLVIILRRGKNVNRVLSIISLILFLLFIFNSFLQPPHF